MNTATRETVDHFRQGLAGSWVALVTPMHDDGALDEVALSRLIDRHVAAGTAGLVIAGTTGEAAALDDAEYQSLIAGAVRANAGRVPLMAGIGAASTRRCIELAAIAAAQGAQAALAVTPYYLRTTQDGLVRHYETLAEATSLPIMLYNVPGRTGVDLRSATTARLARDSRIVGIKEAVADMQRVRALAARCGPRFAILSGDDASCLAALENGARGVISVTANVLPGAMARLCQLARDDADEARALQSALAPIHNALMAEPNPIPVKGLLKRLGHVDGGLRLPLVDASSALIDELQQLVESFAAADRL